MSPLEALAAFDRSNQLAGLRPSTRKGFYLDTLHPLLRNLIIPDIRLLHKIHIETYLLEKQGRKLSPVTIQTYYRAIRRFTRWLADEGLTDGDICVGMRKPRVPKVDRPLPSLLEVKRLMAGVSRRHYCRDLLILLLAVDGNLRAGEVRSFRVEDLNFQACTVRVIGKGGHSRVVPLGNRSMQAAHNYLERERISTNEPTCILSEEGKPFTAQGFAQVFRRIKVRLGMNYRFHDLRHWGATDDALHMSPWELQKKLGHASMAITQHYVHMAEQRERSYSSGDALFSR